LSPSEKEETGVYPRQRVAIIGAGHVGATTAYALMLRALVREIVLVDRDMKLADAEATDLSHANALARPTRIWAGSYTDAATARIAILTAGAATHGEQTRLSVASQSAVIVASCVQQLVEAGFEGVIVVAANPVDLMTLIAARIARFPVGRVIGAGTLLDTSRLRQMLASRLGVAPASVEGDVIGEHGDTEVAAFSTVRIGGLKLDRFDTNGRAGAHAELANEVRNAGYRIVAGKGYTSFGVATAIVRICEAILRDEKVILPVSALLTGQYGISETFLSLPCILGAAGVERILAPELTAEEQAGLVASANALKAALAVLDAAA